MRTIFDWLAAHPEFQSLYAQARQAQADYLAEEMLEIADNSTNDWMERRREDGSVVTVPNGQQADIVTDDPRSL
jgi:hypothetical protein